MTARRNLSALLAVWGGRRFAPVDIAASHHELNTEQKLSFVRFGARRRAFLRGTWGRIGKDFELHSKIPTPSLACGVESRRKEIGWSGNQKVRKSDFLIPKKYMGGEGK